MVSHLLLILISNLFLKFSLNLLKDNDYPQIHVSKTSSDNLVNFTATGSADGSSEILIQAHGNSENISKIKIQIFSNKIKTKEL